MAVKISSDAYANLNESYYSADPHMYFSMRLHSLLLMVADGDKAMGILQEGVEFGSIGAKLNASEVLGLDKVKYASAEAVVLLHHSCEALLRLYLAHQKRTPCPWAAMSGLTNFAEFKREVKSLLGRLDDEATQLDILEVFSSSSDGERLGINPEVWASHRRGLIMIIDFAAREFLDRSNLYNAAKHGFAVVPHDAGMKLGSATFGDSTSELSTILEKTGPALTYLERVGDPGKQEWQKTTRWVSSQNQIGWIYMVTEQMKNLWTAAKAHRGIPSETKGGLLVKLEVVELLLESHYRPDDVQFDIKSMSESIPSA